ncbi:unnamed protein product [Trypanosoma congolense IL3000]|uniref:WGS project CAEQ00000000 data, annotated contig 2260 n=1 Tax=Trypanosoma congolense (strain IL3000) TaxID=1068625 RepID=F9WCS2_TRYCI|nr:unnamed protein product [Trypanosoma congolense IL3000]
MQIGYGGDESEWTMETKAEDVLLARSRDLYGVSAYDFLVTYYNNAYGLDPENFVSLAEFLNRPSDYVKDEKQRKDVMSSMQYKVARLDVCMLENICSMQRQGIRTLNDWACQQCSVNVDRITKGILTRAVKQVLQSTTKQGSTQNNCLTHHTFLRHSLLTFMHGRLLSRVLARLSRLPRQGSDTNGRESVLQKTGEDLMPYVPSRVLCYFPEGVERRDLEHGKLYVPKPPFPIADAFFFVKEKNARHTNILLIKVVTEVTLQPLQMNESVVQAFWERMSKIFKFWDCFASLADWEIIYIHSSSDTLLPQSVEMEHASRLQKDNSQEFNISFWDDIQQYQIVLDADRIHEIYGENMKFPFGEATLPYSEILFEHWWSIVTRS